MLTFRGFIFTSGLLLAFVLAACGIKPEPKSLPPPADPVVEQPSTTESSAPPAKVEPPPSTPLLSTPQTKAESPTGTNSEDELRRVVGSLARKEGGKWTIDKEARLKLDELGPQMVDQLLPLLTDKSTDVRRGAAIQLLPLAASRHDLAAAYAALLDDPDATVRGIALGAIGQLKPAQKAAAAPALAKLVASTTNDEQQRATAARLLGDLGREAATLLPQLTAAAAHDISPKVRSAALLAIGRVAEPADAVGIFIQSLNDQESAVRLVALQRLRELGRDAAPALDDLGKLLDSKDEKIRRTAAEALVGIGLKSVPVLIAALDASSRDAREVAVIALGKMGSLAKPALPALKKRLGDSDPKVKELAKGVILELELQ